MDITSYNKIREIVQTTGQPLLYIALFLAVLLVIFYANPKLRDKGPYILKALFVTLFISYGLLIWFHFKIYTLLPLTDATGSKIIGRYMIPPWIENEKLLFWTFLTSFWLLLSKPKRINFTLTLYCVMPLLILLTIFTSNPFVEPLGSFNQQIVGIDQALSEYGVQMHSYIIEQAKHMMNGYYNSAYMWLHPPLLFFAYSAFVFSFIGSIFMLTNRDFESEIFAYNWAKAGYIVLTLGLLLGYPWTIQAWKGQPWWFSPKVNVTIIMWVLYTAYLHSRLYLNRKNMYKTTAILGILSFIGVVMTYISTYILPGIHSVSGL